MITHGCDAPKGRGTCGQPAETYIIRIGKKVAEVDLCEVHSQPMLKALSWGRTVGSRQKKDEATETPTVGL